MKLITKFTDIIFRRHDTPKEEMAAATMYINKAENTAAWLCPCGCGSVLRTKISPRWNNLPYGVAGINIDEEGHVSFNCGFSHPRCPNNFVYSIKDNVITVWPYYEASRER